MATAQKARKLIRRGFGAENDAVRFPDPIDEGSSTCLNASVPGHASALAGCPMYFSSVQLNSETQASITERKAPKLRYMDPMLLILPEGLIQAALIVVATCYANSGSRAVRNDLIGIRLWSTTFSDEAWRVGHRAGTFYSWLLAVVAVTSLTIGIWLIQLEPPPSDAQVSVYTLGTLASTLAVTGLMILRAYQAAKQVAIDQVLEEEGDEIDALLDEQYGEEG